MKTALPLLFGLLCLTRLSAQTPLSLCGTDPLPNPVREHTAVENAIQARTVTYLPTVVHVIYKSPIWNLSDEEVHEIMEKVNQDYRRMNPDTVDTPDAFKPFAADTQIEFALATTDPWGNPTTGITRTVTPIDGFGVLQGPPDQRMKYDSSGGKSAWDTHHYINVWLVEINIGSLGYTTDPSHHGMPFDGIVVASNPLGFETNRILTHELGHYLGLKHTFGDEFSCEWDDGIEDTPLQYTHSWLTNGNCPVFPLTDICSPEFPGIMFMNFMDAIPDCANLFTHQQAAAMQEVIAEERGTLLEPIVGTSEYANQVQLELFPNPVQDLLAVQLEGAITTSPRAYRLFDAMGRLVWQQEFNHSTSKDELDVTAFAAGVYWLECRAGKQAFSRMFVKQ